MRNVAELHDRQLVWLLVSQMLV